MERALILALAAAVLIGAAVCASAQTESNSEPGCDGSTYEMVECLKGKTASWDKRLNAAYQKLLKEIQPKQREQLRIAQRSWVQYRDANCLFWSLGEGTIARIEAGDCMYRMTKDRAEELEGVGQRN